MLLDGFLDEPLLLTYNGNRINCLSNVCTHRGNILIEKASQASKLICGYHGRGFDLDGQYKYMPGFDKTEKLPRECDHLANIPMTRWNQFLFVSLNPGFDFSGVMKAMDDRIGFLPISDFRFMPKKSRDYEVKAHWALYCNNYLEGFHIPCVHKALNEVIHSPDDKTVLFDHCNLQIGYSKNRTEAFYLPKTHIDFSKSVAAYYFCIFPNMMFNFYPWGLSINIVKPVSLEKTRIYYLTYVWDESKLEGSAGAELDKVEFEDQEVVENVQRGIKSRYYNTGRFSPTMEKEVHHFQRLLSEFIG